jgi:general secretion pathway protein G
LVELVVVVVAIGILIGLALDRLLPLIGRAQRAAFVQVQGQLQSALLLEAAERITRGESRTLAELAGVNPMSLLLRPPQNYLGAIASPADTEIPSASWYYDEHSARLVYRVGRYTRFERGDGPKDRIELRVAFIYRDRDGDAAYEPASDAFGGLLLEPVYAYKWPD